MVCDDVRRVAYFYLDGVLGDARSHDLVTHLECCTSCGDRIIIHRRLRTLVRTRLGQQPAPEHLRQRIHSAVLQGPRPESI